MRICHLTSVHPRGDSRIFIKMCRSLAAHGHAVTLVVADGKGDEILDGVAIRDAGASRGRVDRIRRAPRRLFDIAAPMNADIYHLHDPELLPVGVRLARLGKRVIFDSHEDVPKQLLDKPYLNKPLLRVISRMFAIYEKRACRRFAGVIAATPSIREKFLRINPTTVDINNFPLLDELVSEAPWTNKRLEVCYVGGIVKVRGVGEVVQAMGKVTSGVRLNLAGQFDERDLEVAIKADAGWGKVNELGFLGRQQVRDVLGRSMAGLVTLHPVANLIDALPIKMFEYMSASIPVIASNFPLWREIVGDNQCGLLVDPLDPGAIARAIDYLVTHPDEARRMGENGRKAVIERYNWPVQEKKLLAFYERLAGVSPG